jgi:hypothetical protein
MYFLSLKINFDNLLKEAKDFVGRPEEFQKPIFNFTVFTALIQRARNLGCFVPLKGVKLKSASCCSG